MGADTRYVRDQTNVEIADLQDMLKVEWAEHRLAMRRWANLITLQKDGGSYGVVELCVKMLTFHHDAMLEADRRIASMAQFLNLPVNDEE